MQQQQHTEAVQCSAWQCIAVRSQGDNDQRINHSRHSLDITATATDRQHAATELSRTLRICFFHWFLPHIGIHRSSPDCTTRQCNRRAVN